MSRVVRYFADADMRAGYDGLTRIAKKEDVDIPNLGQGEFVVFVNRQRNKMKLCTQNDIVAYMRMGRGQKIDPRVIQYLPRYFDGKSFDYDAAMRRVLQKYFPTFFDRRGSLTG